MSQILQIRWRPTSSPLQIIKKNGGGVHQKIGGRCPPHEEDPDRTGISPEGILHDHATRRGRAGGDRRDRGDLPRVARPGAVLGQRRRGRRRHAARCRRGGGCSTRLTPSTRASAARPRLLDARRVRRGLPARPRGARPRPRPGSARLDPMFHLALHAGRQAWHARPRRPRGSTVAASASSSATSSCRPRRPRPWPARPGPDLRRAGWAPRPRHSEPTEPLNTCVAGLPAGVRGPGARAGRGGVHARRGVCVVALRPQARGRRAAGGPGRRDAHRRPVAARPALHPDGLLAAPRAVAPSGRPSPFDARGDGLVVGEGAGMFVLKRLGDALRQGDTIYGVIAGVGLSNDVDGGLLAPSSEGQLRAMRAAYDRAGWDPRDVDLIECHATGTPVGDAVEFASLTALWGEEGWAPGPLRDRLGQVEHRPRPDGRGRGRAARRCCWRCGTGRCRRRPTSPRPRRGSSYEGEPVPRPDRGRAVGGPRRGPASPRGGQRVRVRRDQCPCLDRRVGAGLGGDVSGEGQAVEGPALDAAEPSPGWRRGCDLQSRSPIVGMAAHFGPFAGPAGVPGARARRATSRGAPAAPRNWWGAQESAWFRREGYGSGAFRGYHARRRWRCGSTGSASRRRSWRRCSRSSRSCCCVAADAIADAGWDDRPRPRAGVFVGIGLDLNTTNFHVRWSLLEQGPRVEPAARARALGGGARRAGWTRCATPPARR